MRARIDAIDAKVYAPSHRAALQGDVAAAEAAHGTKSGAATKARSALSRYDGHCCRADMGQRMINREQRRTGHAA